MSRSVEERYEYTWHDASELSEQKADWLRGACRERGIPVSGAKHALRTRLVRWSQRPRIDMVTATYDRVGRCSCGRKITRQRTFRAPTLERCNELASEWTEPLRHRGCA